MPVLEVGLPGSLQQAPLRCSCRQRIRSLSTSMSACHRGRRTSSKTFLPIPRVSKAKFRLNVLNVESLTRSFFRLFAGRPQRAPRQSSVATVVAIQELRPVDVPGRRRGGVLVRPGQEVAQSHNSAFMVLNCEGSALDRNVLAPAVENFATSFVKQDCPRQR